ncbi:MAG: tRNA uridine-5-carboxymethylaminomethyl(34) synthesis GTPase MnmE [Bacteroidetes bacterium]|nr:tRNA uridine-5-carboxymethylaminomethyl(34) synthesis GTPase MnmE [Bacteroidota bacterium]
MRRSPHWPPPSASAVGIGGIAVIRISGEHAFAAADAVFRGSMTAAGAASHTVHYGTVTDPVSRETIDTVVLTVFRNPHSFTGEDVVEISAHGGYFVAQRILTLLYANGARPAAPGEFTLRAFLNGKLDLSQAEAVADIIHATTERSHRASVDQLSGKLSRAVRSLRQEILDLCSLLELELDFSQEGIELADKNTVLSRLDTLERSIRLLAESYREGRIIREGIKVALVGRPNAGKSSLLNALLQEERAIVSDIPGTTRDTIEEKIVLEGIEFLFQDTAGLRESSDSIEVEGMRRTNKAIAAADVILFLLDGSIPLSNDDLEQYRTIAAQYAGSKTILWVFNKQDVRAEQGGMEIGTDPLWISCKSHAGLKELKETLVRLTIPGHDPSASSVTITNVRHRDALDRARHSILTARQAVAEELGGDFVAVDLHAAVNYLGEIIGLTTPDDILNNIFSNFCIGK